MDSWPARVCPCLGQATGAGYQQSVAAALNAVGEVARDRNDLRTADARHQASLDLHRQLGDRWGVALSRYGLARVAHRRADTAEAAARCGEALDLVRALGVKRDIAACLELATAILAAERFPREASELLDAAAALRAESGMPLAPADRPEHDAIVAAVEAAAGRDGATTAPASQRRLSLGAAIGLAADRLGRVASSDVPG